MGVKCRKKCKIDKTGKKDDLKKKKKKTTKIKKKQICKIWENLKEKNYGNFF